MDRQSPDGECVRRLALSAFSRGGTAIGEGVALASAPRGFI